jgi:hypothetical protein
VVGSHGEVLQGVQEEQEEQEAAAGGGRLQTAPKGKRELHYSSLFFLFCSVLFPFHPKLVRAQ